MLRIEWWKGKASKDDVRAADLRVLLYVSEIAA